MTRDLRVVVKAPLRLPVREIEAFVAKHGDWIGRQLERQKQRSENAAAHALTPEEVAAARERARQIFTERVAHYAPIMDVRPAGIKITSAETRWGSCSGRNSLCFSWRTALLPPECVDAIVVHELAHIRVKNHGPRFYAEVLRVMPDYHERLSRLRAAQEELGL